MAATIVRISPFGDRCICWPLKLMKKMPIKATMKPTTKLILKGSSLKHRKASMEVKKGAIDIMTPTFVAYV